MGIINVFGLTWLLTMASATSTAWAGRGSERVNCAGALSTRTGSPGDGAWREFVIGGREINVSITSADRFRRPFDAKYLEFAMADDRVPIVSARMRPLIRSVVNALKRKVTGRTLVRLDAGADDVLTSAQIKDYAAQLEARGLDRSSLERADFDVRIGRLLFTGREFWTGLYPAADGREFVNLNAERGFNSTGSGWPSNVMSQIQTWGARGVLLAGAFNAMTHQFNPGQSNLVADFVTLLFVGGAGTLLHDTILDDLKERRWLRPIQQLLYILPDFKGLLNSARLPVVRDHRARVLAENVEAAVAKYPDLSTVHIIAPTWTYVRQLTTVLDARFETPAQHRLQQERAVWTWPDPTFERFPQSLRGKNLDLSHRPTADLVDSLKTTFAPRAFGTIDDFTAYYRPDRLPGWSEGRHDWTFQQIVGTYLFDSLRWSLPQFFALKPTPDQIRALMELPAHHFDRKQLHEYPSGNAVRGTLLVIAKRAEEIYADDEDQRARAIVDFAVLGAAEWHGLAKHLGSRGVARDSADRMAATLRPPPASFLQIPGNRDQLVTIAPDLEKFPAPADGW